MWGTARRVFLPIGLLVAYLSSVFFSYFYMFDAIVMPGIAYDDYIESIDLVNNTTEAFENELTKYRTELVNALTRFNSDTAALSGLANNDIGTIDGQIQTLESDLAVAERTVQESWARLQEIDQENAAYDDYLGMYRAAYARYTDIQTELDNLRESRRGSAYILYQAIRLLTQYYGDPLYLQGNVSSENDRAALVAQLGDTFDTVMHQYALHAAQDTNPVNQENIRTAFNNYTMLCEYYADHGSSGLDLSGGEDSVESLLAQRADILSEYSNLREREENMDSTAREEDYPSPGGIRSADAAVGSAGGANASGSTNTQDTSDGATTASDYLNRETGKLLIAAMRVLENIPRFSVVGELWISNGITSEISPTEPNVSNYLHDLNQKYRVSNGQLRLQERALSKLHGEHAKTAIFSFIMAIVLDALIIALCFLRSREYYANNVRNRRQMISLLFVVPNTEEELKESEQGRRIILTGTVLGCFVYLLYFKFYPNMESSTSMAAFVLIICGILLVALLNSLRAAFRKKQPDTQNDSDNLDDSIQKRLRKPVYELFKKNLHTGRFRKTSSVRSPRTDAVKRGIIYYQEEEEIWRQKEDHKIRTYVLSKKEYDTIITSCDENMEYYIPAKIVSDANLTLQFAVLESHKLVYQVMAPIQPEDACADTAVPAKADETVDVPTDAGDNVPNKAEGTVLAMQEASAPVEGAVEPDNKTGGTCVNQAENVPVNKAAYLLTDEFIRLLCECIMLRTIAGNSWEYGLEDDILDYEREDDDED